MKCVIVAVCAVLFGCRLATAEGNTWYVDDDNYGKSGLDGLTPETAYGTIQDAIDASTTTTGDTILVLPGIYDKGVCLPTEYLFDGLGLKHKARVFITKDKLTIRSTGGREVTHIVGQHDDSGAYGTGPDAVTCVYVGWDRYRFVMEGFTIRDGAVHERTDVNNSYNNGGGIAYYNGESVLASTFHVIDCAISNCVSRFAMVANCTLHRCLVAHNRSTKTWGVFAYGSAENTVFLDNYGSAAERASLVNCVLTGTRGGKVTSNCATVCNTIFAYNDQDLDYSYASGYPWFTNSVTTARGCDASSFVNAYNSELNANVTNLFVARSYATSGWWRGRVPLTAAIRRACGT